MKNTFDILAVKFGLEHKWLLPNQKPSVGKKYFRKKTDRNLLALFFNEYCFTCAKKMLKKRQSKRKRENLCSKRRFKTMSMYRYRGFSI